MSISARYLSDNDLICATIDGVEWFARLNTDTEINRKVYEWVQSGGIITPYSPPALTQDDYRAAIQAHIDTVARARNYDSGASCAGYVTSSVSQWSEEAAVFVSWRDAVWLYAFSELAKVEAGTRGQPTILEFVDELPTIEWPS